MAKGCLAAYANVLGRELGPGLRRLHGQKRAGFPRQGSFFSRIGMEFPLAKGGESRMLGIRKEVKH